MKYIFISGGVVSGLGKGITSASIGSILQGFGLSVTSIKIDMYLNVDAGTIRPQEHGEVFVTHDGLETDQDLGNYERFLNRNLNRHNYLTTGQIYKAVIDRERAFGYEGEDVEAIPHVTDEIINRITQAGQTNHADIVLIELGGTVGEFQNGLFFEANRILKLRHPEDVVHIHVTYLPFLKNIGELKSKPAQQSSQMLNSLGIQPDFIVARSELPIDDKRRDKLAVFCNLHLDDIIGNPDVDSIYRLPHIFDTQHFGQKILAKLHLKPKTNKPKLAAWDNLVKSINSPRRTLSIALVGKYFNTGDYQLTDSYISVIEAVKHAAWKLGLQIEFHYFDSEEFAKHPADLTQFAGLIVPQGWGSRGTEGKIKAIQIAREQKIPFLGLCFGMQMASIEFARHILKLKDANSIEVNPKTSHPVIHIMPEQQEYLRQHQYGGTIRLGAWPCKIKKDTHLYRAYQKFGRQQNAPWYQDRDFHNLPHVPQLVYERHRHRYEFNNIYQDQFKKAGFVFSGTSPDGQLIEAVEVKDHPFFLGTQFHPEYISRPLTPHPVFLAFLSAAAKE